MIPDGGFVPWGAARVGGGVGAGGAGAVFEVEVAVAEGPLEDAELPADRVGKGVRCGARPACALGE